MISGLGFTAEIVLIMRSGKILMIADSLRTQDKSILDGTVFEIMFKTISGDPIFVYYKSQEYYAKLLMPIAIGSIGNAHIPEQWRTYVSKEAAKFVYSYIRNGKGILARLMSASDTIVNFSHNKKHTNVMAYIESHNNWFPIRHNENEPESAIDKKIEMVNAGQCNITDLISITEDSP